MFTSRIFGPRQNHTAYFMCFSSFRDLGFIDESFKLLRFLLHNLNLGIDAIFERESKVTPQMCVCIEFSLWIFVVFILMALKKTVLFF